MSIFYDIDDVCRDLNTEVFGKEKPTSWNSKTKDGMSCIEKVNSDLDILLRCKPTKYFDTIINFCKEHGDTISLLSTQPKEWQENTNIWISRYIVPKIKTVEVIYSKDSADKLTYLKEGDWLVDDSPNFPDYSQIILVDELYNQNIKADIRVKNPKELKEILERLGDK